MFKSYNNIWHQFSYFPNSPQKIFTKRLNKIKICIQDTNNTPIYSTSCEIKNKRKRGRRNLKSGELYDLALHTKDNDDNIKRKVKTHFHNFIIAYLNMIIKNTIKTKRQYKFKKMSSKITQDITISFNKKLMNTSIKDILIQVSNKFKNKDINLYYIEKISQIKENNLNENIYTLNDILNISYKDMMNNFYLKSTKKLFENEKIDESFEKHIENLMNKYGYNYAMKFKQNAENFVNFYINSKQRNHKKNKETSYISSDNKDKVNNILNQKEIKDLDLGLNEENYILDFKNGKKFFEIIRDNSINDNISKCNSSKTQSQTNSCDGLSEKEENEKTEKDQKTFLNKKRNSVFKVFFCEKKSK